MTYPYANIAKTLVDIGAELRKLQTDTTITSDFEFQTRIARAITRLQDGHFSYATTCYSVMQFFQPWVITTKYTAGNPKPTLYLRDLITKGSTLTIDLPAVFPNIAAAFTNNLITAFTRAMGQDPSLLIGYEIVAIDGQDPITAVQQYADAYVGSSHTAETRFNFALAQTQYIKGSLQVKDGPFFTTSSPSFDLPTVRNYTLRNPQNGQTVSVAAPWLGLFPSTSTAAVTSTRYRQAFCGGASGTGAISRASTNPYRDDPNNAIAYMAYLQGLKYDEQVMALLRAGRKSAVKRAPPAPVFGDTYNGFYYLSDTKTGVFTMPSFLPVTADGSLSEDLVTSWLQNMAKGLVALEARQPTNLILDFTNNGGGIICAGKALMEYMFAGFRFVQYDVRLTPTSRYLLQNADRYVNKTAPNPFIMNDQVIPDGASVSANAINSLLSNTKTYTRGGVTEPFSQKFDIDCADVSALFAKFPQLTSGGWNPANVAVLTNGFCGSTCGEVVRSLRSQYGVKVYVYGGTTGTAFQPTSFEGGSVLDFDGVLDAFVKIPRLSGVAPPNGTLTGTSFPVPARGQVLFWESYSPARKSDTPDEWIVDPADAWISVADGAEVVEAWGKVAALMPTTKMAPLKKSAAVGRSAGLGVGAVVAVVMAVAVAFDIDCADVSALFAKFPQLTSGGWNPANVAVLTNGFCGSTCGEVVRSLRSQYGVKVYVYGGTTGTAFQPTSFEGGSVLDFDGVLDAFVKIPRLSGVAPPNGTLTGTSFPVPARGQVLLFWESYSPARKSDTPDEWIVDQADGWISVADGAEVVEAWEKVAALMPTTKMAALRKSMTLRKSAAVGRVAGFGVGAVVALAVALSLYY
ncbi:hypothetical protein HDU96_004885 [Phlyctochytrium bullatum]|nr:hypothetical protein HDU96_004885 [Phlyctochytrium bullatum]